MHAVKNFINRDLAVSSTEEIFSCQSCCTKHFANSFTLIHFYFAHEIIRCKFIQDVSSQNLLRCCLMKVTECKILVVSNMYCKTL